MNGLEIAFWIALGVVFYTYIGYGLVLGILVFARRRLDQGVRTEPAPDQPFEPDVTLLVAAYNEEDCILDKVRNTLALDYPREKLHLLFVTDGSTDQTPNLLRGVPGVTVLHQAARAGKIGAINRAMPLVTTPIVVFSDANAMLNPGALRAIVRHYRNPQVGAVAGEKRIHQQAADTAGRAGEGLYWRYESTLKRLDSALHSVVGAAGELFSIRTALFTPVEPDTLLDDFIISLRIAGRGYRVVYEPDAFALENASACIGEELKRKIRICAGGFQAIVRLRGLLNVRRHGLLSFQYVSHRVLRWAVTPLLLLFLVPLNLWLVSTSWLYAALFIGQIVFYALAAVGWLLKSKPIRAQWLFAPFYFLLMNGAAFAGFARFITRRQSVLWEKAARA